MKIKSINIKNFKSIVDITINEPNPFTVFVGPNGSGKSNIFEALEFSGINYLSLQESWNLLAPPNEVLNKKILTNSLSVSYRYSNGLGTLVKEISSDSNFTHWIRTNNEWINEDKRFEFKNFWKSNFCRIFVNSTKYQKLNIQGNERLSTSCDNLEKVLKRILQNPVLREEILDYLRMLVPELENIEIVTDEIDGDSKLRIYEKFSKKPFNKALISDGTYNILCLLTAVYQSEEPQFLCIEEPENGLSPYAIETLVGLFRSHCQDYGHYIWLNTHSQTLVRNLKPEEFILVDKIEGETKIKQFRNEDLEGWRMDEAWLTNALGGGLPW